jgi:hypothetical protein
MQVRALVALLLLAGAGRAQEPRDPHEAVDDEPTPQEPPPVIYVPIPPPIVAPPPYAPYAQAEPARAKKGGFFFRLDLGGAYRYALKDSFGAGALRMLLGGESGHVGFGGVLDLEMGASQGGLFYSVLDIGFQFYGVIGDVVRLGMGAQLGFMTIQRATNADPFEDLVGFLIGLNADLSIDLIKSRRSALLLFGRLRYDFTDARVASYSHGATALIGLGVRL